MKASDDEASKATKCIANDYALIDRNKITLTLRRPMFMADRNNPDLDATEAMTVEAYEQGEIDRAECERQAELLETWRKAYRPNPQ